MKLGIPAFRNIESLLLIYLTVHYFPGLASQSKPWTFLMMEKVSFNFYMYFNSSLNFQRKSIVLKLSQKEKWMSIGHQDTENRKVFLLGFMFQHQYCKLFYQIAQLLQPYKVDFLSYFNPQMIFLSMLFCPWLLAVLPILFISWNVKRFLFQPGFGIIFFENASQ